MSNIFSAANKLKDIVVKIDEIELLSETILSIDMSFLNDSPIVNGNIVFNDIFDMSLIVDWLDVVVSIKYVDVLDNTTSKSFKIRKIKEHDTNGKEKTFELYLQDTFSYTLEHSFLSKSYNSTVSAAFQEYIEHLELTDYTTKITATTESKRFVVPKNMNNLEFFTKEFRKAGYTLYQTRDAICLKSLDDLSVANMTEIESPFYNETDNQLYMNKILQFNLENFDRQNVKPKTRSFAYNPDTKTMEYDNSNDNSDYVMNTNTDTVLDTHGYDDVYQQHLNFNDHKLKFKESILKQSGIVMVVNGYGTNNVNQIYSVKLKGLSVNAISQSKGNLINSGKYVSTLIRDKIIGDSYIQKIYLNRADSTSRE